jgi:hypothetical protein
LNLSGNCVGDEGARALARSPNLRNLTELRLSTNAIEYAGLRALAGSRHFRADMRITLRGFDRSFAEFQRWYGPGRGSDRGR